MSYDSLLQWQEMATGKYTEISPAFHTFTNWLFTRLWPSPAAIALFQILSLSLVVGWALYLFRKAGAPKWACGFSAALIAISPVCAATTITLWKDNPYTTALLVFSLLLFQLSVTDGRWLQKTGVWIAFGISGALAALFRHNGLPSVVTSFAVLLLLYPKSRRYTIYSIFVFLSLFALVRGPLYRQLAVDQSFREWHYGMRLLHYLAAYSQHPKVLSSEQSSIIQNLWPAGAPLPYDCYFTDTTHFNIAPRLIIEHIPALENALFQLFLAEPRIALDHFFCANDLIWRISEPANSYLSTYDFSNYWDRTAYVANAGLTPIPIQSQLPGLKPILADFLFITNSWIIWRPALYLYLALYCGLVFALRHCRAPSQEPQILLSSRGAPSEMQQSSTPSPGHENLLQSNPPSQAEGSNPRRQCLLTSLSFYTPLVIHTLVLLGINASQETRFQYFAYLLCLLSICLIFIPHPSPIIIPQPTDTTTRIPQ
jgi:hypothetical protein